MAIHKQAGKTLSDRALERVMRDVMNGVWDRSLQDLYKDDSFGQEIGEMPDRSETISLKKQQKP